MTDKFLSAVIRHTVKNVFADNEETIVAQLTEGCDPEQKLDPVATKLLIRGMMLSAQMAVQVTIRILESANVVETIPDFAAFTQMINDEIIKSSNEKEEQSKN